MSLLRHTSSSAADTAPYALRTARCVPTRHVSEAVGASMTDARATAELPRSIRPWVAAPEPLGPVGRHLSTAARERVVDDDPTRGGWETVVGLELHVQLGTATKLFSAAPRRVPRPDKDTNDASVSEDAPNVAVAAFDAAWPGALPSLNRHALELVARLGIALGGVVARRTSFDRKHYHYADQPHGYQITQRREPVVLGGALDVFVSPDRRVALRVERLQLETDTGKSLRRRSRRDDDATVTCDRPTEEWLVDYNRAGCALVEIVTRPDLRSAEEAAAAVEAFQRIVRFLEVGDANMEDGSLRADVNVSVRRRRREEDGGGDDEETEFSGERCEIKNLNSTRSVLRAVRHEAARQISILESGGVVRRETRGFDAETGWTTTLRGKEALADYRFAPEPDVPPVFFTDADVAELARGVPELPDAAKTRLTDPNGAHRLPGDVSDTLVAHPTTLAFYERALRAARAETAEEARETSREARRGNRAEREIEIASGSRSEADPFADLPRTVARWVTGDLVGAARRAKVALRKNAPLAHLPGGERLPAAIGELVGMVAAGKCTARMAKKATAAMLEQQEPRGVAPSAPSARRALASLFGEGFEATAANASREEQANALGGAAEAEKRRGENEDDAELALRRLCFAVVAEKPSEAALFRGGKTRLMGAFVGEVMRRTEGRADPRRAAALVKEALRVGDHGETET